MFQVFRKDKIYAKLRDEKLFMLTTICGSEKFSKELFISFTKTFEQ